jgi:hypothetical protein
MLVVPDIDVDIDMGSGPGPEPDPFIAHNTPQKNGVSEENALWKQKDGMPLFTLLPRRSVLGNSPP